LDANKIPDLERAAPEDSDATSDVTFKFDAELKLAVGTLNAKNRRASTSVADGSRGDGFQGIDLWYPEC
jgi:hypothetical protein